MPRLQVLRIGPFVSGVCQSLSCYGGLASSPPPSPTVGLVFLRPQTPPVEGLRVGAPAGYAGAPFVWKGSPCTFACGRVAPWSWVAYPVRVFLVRVLLVPSFSLRAYCFPWAAT
ncbi:hypothetical protein GWK47_045153 [Chionoecetes opilio]|uniref:Uncharacterized protein n=1 Tax=Chionoecetes opilio TaxID=41210 RepID=A0A8J4YIK6_CHIOP|nr:hypothetical protein GWK47_045153 [Chionoecetes opilio]